MGAASHGGTDARGFDKEFTRWTVPNVETLSGNKTITSTDARVQLLDPGVSDRDVTLDASLHVTGTLVDIHATGEVAYEINVKNSAATLIARLIYDQSVKVVYASGAWRIINLPYTAEYGTDREHLYVGYRNNVTALHLSIGSAHKAWIDSTGFGVGNSPPSSLFHVTAAGDANALRVDNTTGYVTVGGRLGINVTPSYPLHVSGVGYWQDGNDYVTINPNSSTITIFDDGVESLQFGVAGGTGTVNRNWTVNATTIKIAPVTPASQAATLSLYRAGYTEWSVDNTSASELDVSKDSVVKLRISAVGYVGVGSVTPSSLFHVTASGNANALRVDNTTGYSAFGAAPDSATQLLVNNTASSAYVGGLLIHAPNLTNGQQVYMALGIAASNNNRIGMGFYRVGDGSSDKYLTMSTFAGPEVLRITVGGIITCPSTTGAFSPPVLTTTQRDALAAVKGMIVYNATTDKHQGYNGAWTDFY